MRGESQGGDPRTVTDPRAVAVLLDRGQVRYLAPFMGTPRSVSEAAAELGVTIDHLLPRVRRLHRLGLLRVAARRSRRGRPITVYEAVASEFYVPWTSTPEGELLAPSERHWHQRWLRAANASMQRAFLRLPGAGVHVARNEQRIVTIRLATAPHTPWDVQADQAPALAYGWRALRLRREDAKRLQDELYEVVHRYQDQQAEQGSTYVVGLHLALEHGEGLPHA